MNPLFVGIDVSSKNNVVCLMKPDGTKFSTFSVQNNLGGARILSERIVSALSRPDGAALCAAQGNTAGGPLAFQPLTGSLKVLLITTQSLPPGLLRRAAGVSFSSHRQSMAIGPAMVAPLRAKCIALRRTRPTPLIWCAAVCTSWRFSRCRSCQ